MNIKKISVVVCICCFLSNNFAFAFGWNPFASCCKKKRPNVDSLKIQENIDSYKLPGTGCNIQKFESFKELLKSPSKKSEDFFVITVTRTGKKPLLKTEMKLLPLLLKQLFSGKEDYDKYKKEVDNVVQQHEEELEERIKAYNKRDPLTGVLWTTDDLKERIIAIFKEIGSWIEQVNNPKGCKLGKWFAAQTDSRIKGCAAFGKAQRDHEELHRHATDCFKAAQAGHRDEAMRHFEMTYQSYKELCNTLADLHKQLRSAGYTEVTDYTRKT